jgi:hypothetical protein
MSDHEILNIILNRMNHQDRTLDEIKNQQSDMKQKLDTHMQMEADIRPSIDELIGVLKGSKFIGRIVFWLCSIAGAAWGFIVWSRDHIKIS